MANKKLISRRQFVKSSAIGASLLGLGTAKPSKADTGPAVSKFPKRYPREVSVLVFTLNKIMGLPDVEGRLFKHLEVVPSFRPDVVCVPEAFVTTAKTPQTVPGPFFNRCAAFAKKHSCYFLCPVNVRQNGKTYNSVFVLDRKGDIVGQYNKIHPTEAECDDGVTPGSIPPPVFKTDFGIVGIQVCFDVNWIDEWTSLKQQGAEVVFYCSAYPAGRMLSGLAWIHGYYVVGVPMKNPALVFDINGDLIARNGRWEHFCSATLNLEKALFETDVNSHKVKKIREKYGRKVDVRFWHDESWITIECLSHGLTVKQIIKEFDLITRWDYIKRAGEYQKKFRDNIP